MEQNEFDNLIYERKAKLELNIKDRIKKQWIMFALLLLAALAMIALGAYLIAIGGYVLGAVLLAVGIGVGTAVAVLHFRALKKMNKMLDELKKLGVKK